MNPEQFFNFNRDKLICLDEIQRVPELFNSLRSIIDEDRRSGRFVILGSASRDLIRQSSESLAGRIAYVELSPFIFPEIEAKGDVNKLWMQGGFPDSFLSEEKQSLRWCTNFIRTFLERDIPQIGFSIPADTKSVGWGPPWGKRGEPFWRPSSCSGCEKADSVSKHSKCWEGSTPRET